MPKKPKSETWIPLQTFFARAANYGVADITAAEALLDALKDSESDVCARALERIFEDRRSKTSTEVTRQIFRAQTELFDLAHIAESPVGTFTEAERERATNRWAELNAFVKSFEGERENLPRRLDPVIIPSAFWSDFNSVDDACTSDWCDDDEKPANWGQIDWLSGTGRSFEWWGSFHRAYSVMQIDRELGFKIVDRLAGGGINKSMAEDHARTEFIGCHHGDGEVRNTIYKEWQEHALFDGTDRDTFENDWYRVRNIPRKRGRKPRKP